MKSKLETILLIDDDIISNYITEELLRDNDLCSAIHTATDGKKGLHFLQQLLADKTVAATGILVLLDLNMPMMDGFEFMEELQARQLDQQIIVAVLTSSDNHKDMSQARKYNFAAYLQKPLSVDELNAVIENSFINQ